MQARFLQRPDGSQREIRGHEGSGGGTLTDTTAPTGRRRMKECRLENLLISCEGNTGAHLLDTER